MEMWWEVNLMKRKLNMQRVFYQCNFKFCFIRLYYGEHITPAPCAARGRVGGPAAEAHGGGAALPPEPAEGHVPRAASPSVLCQPPAIPGEAATAAAAQVGPGVDPAAAAAAVAPAPRGVRGLGPPPPVAPLLPVTTPGVATTV